jgi:hypothetical protein
MLALALWALAVPAARAAEAEGPLRTDSPVPYTHRIALYDAAGEVIAPADNPARPWSPRATCGKCHDYETIASGWHFNEGLSGAAGGRPGEPWILADARTGTQLPLSARGWAGTWTPAQAGLSQWAMIRLFGRHMPGGGLGERAIADDKDPQAGWAASGALEIDCLACHDASRRHDQAERARQIAERNFKWTPTAAAGLGLVRGSAAAVQAEAAPIDEADPLFELGAIPAQGPKIFYDAARFDADGRVFLDLTRRPEAQRCEFCHAQKLADQSPGDAWQADPDVHLAAGLRCADCHRNGLDHAIVRGDAGARDHGLSCAGCHYGQGAAQAPGGPTAGRLGSPAHDHPGLPALHFEELACTACHSGPWPGEATRPMQTALAHGLGLTSRERTAATPPLIEGPVFLKGADGRIAPHKLLWPAFWAALDGKNELHPILPEDVARLAAGVFKAEKAAPGGKPLSRGDIAKALAALAHAPQIEGVPVYVAAGRLHRLDKAGALIEEDHAGAKPYAWPLAHTVRPGAQALGAGGCADCHAPDSAFYFATLRRAAPADLGATSATLTRMIDLMGEEAEEVVAWGWMFRLRPYFKYAAFALAGLLSLALLLAALRGLDRMSRCGKGGDA